METGATENEIRYIFTFKVFERFIWIVSGNKELYNEVNKSKEKPTWNSDQIRKLYSSVRFSLSEFVTVVGAEENMWLTHLCFQCDEGGGVADGIKSEPQDAEEPRAMQKVPSLSDLSDPEASLGM